MQLTTYVDDLQRQLATAASAGGEESRELAQRLTAPLDAAARLMLLRALADAAGEITTELAPGSVDVRLRGQDPEFVVTAPAVSSDDAGPAPTTSLAADATTAPADTDDRSTTRTTLRLPDELKARVEDAAARDGVSVNTWLVRAVAGALEPTRSKRASRNDARSDRLTGWVR